MLAQSAKIHEITKSCSKCREIKNVSEFALDQRYDNGKRLAACRGEI